jgi:O-antigen/teichoic acid export membrane protein
LAGAFYLFSEGLSYGYEAAAAGVEKPSRFASVQGIGGIAVVAAAFVVLSHDRVTPAGAAFGLASASAVKAVAHWALWRWRGALGPSRRLRELPVRQWLRDALPFLALMVLAAVYYRAGILILHLSRGAEETAPYAAAMRVFDGVVVLGGVVFAAVSPALSRMHRERPEDLWRVWRRMIAVFACAVVPAAAALMVVGEPFARVVFGERYAVTAGDALTALAPGMGLAILQQISASVVYMSDDRGAVLRLTAFNVSVLFVLLVVLTNTSGAHGAAVAMSAAELLSFTTFSLLVWMRHGRHTVVPASFT